MKKKLITFSLLLIGLAVFLVTSSFKADAGTIIPGRWKRDSRNQIIGCLINGDECGITVLRPIDLPK